MKKWAIGFSFFLIGCAHVPQGYKSPHAPNIKIIKHSELDTLTTTSKPYSIYFGNQDDGTRAVEEFLKKAQAEGASFVTDLTITLRGANEKGWNACWTNIDPEGETIRQNETRLVPGQTKSNYVLKPVSRMVTEYEYRCHPVQKSYTDYETVYESQYDYYSKSYRSVPRSRAVTKYRSEQECRSEPVTRMATRYEYQFENQYVPPRWETIATYHTEWKLMESEPECRVETTSPPDPKLPNEVSGVIYSLKPPIAEVK